MSIERRIHRHKNGGRNFTYRAVIRYNNRKITRSFKRKVDAEAWETQQKAKALQGHDIAQQSKKLTIGEAIRLWFVEHIESMTSLSFARGTRQRCNKHIIPWFGKMDMKAVTASHICLFRDSLLKKGLRRETVNTVLKTLHHMFNHHIDQERLLWNPVRPKKHYFKIPQKEEYVWTAEELARFLDYAKQKYVFQHRRIYVFYMIAAHTGARWGEIAVLEKEDFDFARSQVRISKSWDRDTEGIKRPKNGTIRYAPLSEALAKVVQDYFRFARIKDKLFVDKKGRYITYNTFRNVHYLDDVKAAKIPYTKFHNIRRHFIRMLLRLNVSEALVRKVVGHGSVQMTDRYVVMEKDLADIAKVVHI